MDFSLYGSTEISLYGWLSSWIWNLRHGGLPLYIRDLSIGGFLYARTPWTSLLMDTEGWQYFLVSLINSTLLKAQRTLFLFLPMFCMSLTLSFLCISRHTKNSLSFFHPLFPTDLHLNALMDLILSLITATAGASCQCFINVSEYFKLPKLREQNGLLKDKTKIP